MANRKKMRLVYTMKFPHDPAGETGPSGAPQDITPEFIDFLPDGLFKIKSECICYRNQSFSRMFGYSTAPEENTVSVGDIFADPATYANLCGMLERTGGIDRHRVMLRRKGGFLFPGKISLRRRVQNGVFITEGAVSDLSELAALEQSALSKALELEKLTMEMDRFIYSVSHDMRSPVSSIQGLINIMRMELKDDNSAHLIELMAVSVLRLERFVFGLTEFGKTTKKEILHLPVDFNELLRIVLQQLSAHPAAPDTTVHLSVSQEKPLYSDLFRLRLILSNVLKNAFDFTDGQKDEHSISVSIVTFPLNAVITIRDNGIGISPHHIDKVFRIFYRGTNLSKGSGMGLYTAQEAAHVLGGEISIVSEYGVFTEVTINIPNSVKGLLINKRNLLRKGNQ